MKKLLLVAALLGVCAGVAEAGSIMAMNVQPILRSTHTWAGVAITSHTPIDLMLPQPDPAYNKVCVQNNNGNFNIYCSESATIAKTGATKGVAISSASAAGLVIPKPQCFDLVAGQSWFCVHDGATGSVTPTIGRFR